MFLFPSFDPDPDGGWWFAGSEDSRLKDKVVLFADKAREILKYFQAVAKRERILTTEARRARRWGLELFNHG